MTIPNVTQQPVSKKRRLLFIAISVACILITIFLTWNRSEQTVTDGDMTAWEPFHLPRIPRARFPTKAFSQGTRPTTPLPAATPADAPLEPTDLSSVPGSRSIHRGGDLLSLKTFSTPSMTFDGVGVVDMNCLLIVHPPNSDSKEARREAISDIQRAIAARAAAHDFVVVFDRSGQGLNAVPLVLSSAPAFDLTQEVVTQLTDP